MPKTPPTIVAPLPNDPRVMLLSKSVLLTKREAYAAAAESWAWMSVMAVDDMVVKAAPDSLDAVVDIAGFGQAMLQAGLVGVVDDGLVLPAELRHRQHRDERGGGAADDGDGDAIDIRRKAQNAEAARRYRKRAKVTRPKPKAAGNAWRTLGRVAGHEVRAFDGPHGVYVLLLGATVGGESRKLTTGNKAWSLDAVTIVDALPGLVEKWRDIDTKESKRFCSVQLVPSYADLRDDAERVMALAKLDRHVAADAARHDDDDDASCRHADASSSVIISSSSPDAESCQKSNSDKGLSASSASSFRHDDALSSMSVCLTSSSSHEEEDMWGEGRQGSGNYDRADAAEAWTERRDRVREHAARIAAALKLDVETVLQRGRGSPQYLALQCREAGIDPRTGFPLEASSEPVEARKGIDATSDTTADNKPAAVNVEARDEDADRLSHDSHDTFTAMMRQGIPLPAMKDAPGRGRRLEDEDAFERGDEADRLLPIGG